MNLKALSFFGWMILLLAASPCLAARIPSVTASTNMGSGFGTNIQNTVNGVGLSSPDLTAVHAGTNPTNSWVSAGPLTGTVTFNLGGTFSVDSFSFWNQNGGGPGANGSTGIQGVAVSTSIDGITFTPLSGGPTSFAQVVAGTGAAPQIINFAAVSARFFRFTILSNYGDPAQTGFGEAGFNAAGPPPTPTPTPMPGPLTNGSFETGNYTGWITSDMTGPFSPLTVRGSGFTTGFGFFSTAPTDGAFASVDGFDGAGPGNIRIAQDIVIPAGTATLTFAYRAAWDMFNFPGSTRARTLNVIVQPVGGGTNLLSANILTAAAGTVNLDTGNRTASVNLNAFAGQSVRVIIDQFIPEANTGPGLMQIDNVRLVTSPTTIRTAFDFDGDGRADLSVFRPNEGNWYVLRSQAGFNVTSWGLANDIVAPGDFDGDGKADFSVFRPSEGNWYIANSNGTFTVGQFGLPGDIPVPADYDGDGKDDRAVFRPSNSTWYILNSNGFNVRTQAFGLSGDRPVPGDYDGDLRADLAVFRPSNGTWYRANSGNGNFVEQQWGLNGDIPVNADYDGDNKQDLAVFRPSAASWYILNSSNGSFNFRSFGLNGDVPVPADYDGNGFDDIAVFRNGFWYIIRSAQVFTETQFGLAGDKAIPAK